MQQTTQRYRRIMLALLLSGAGVLAFGLNRFIKPTNAAAPTQAQPQPGALSPDGVWQELDPAARRAGGPATFRLNADALTRILNRAPREYTAPLRASEVVLSLPLPDGTYGRFQLEASPSLQPQLAARFPDIKSYRGGGIDDRTASMRCDLSPRGFNALVLAAGQSVGIRPGANNTYLAVSAASEVGQAQCLVRTASTVTGPRAPTPKVAIGPMRRNYRMAIATTGEYSNSPDYGGAPFSVANVIASLNTWLNLTNAIFERDLGAHFDLVNNNAAVIFTNAATDNLTNDNEGTMLNEIMPILDANIGNPNYDIGHVLGLHNGGGGSSAGVASLQSVCNNNNKGSAATRVSGTTGNSIALGVLAHEFGHQFNANHSFNGTVNFCNQRNPATTWETGGGSTMMSYVGICNTDNITAARDLRFHSGSYGEVQTWLADPVGGSCGLLVATMNSAPTINPGGNFTIPRRTPFTLTAVGGDPDAADVPNLTYSWEQLDAGGTLFQQNGTAASYHDGADPNTTTRPIFRAFPPVVSLARTFPSLTYILNNANTPPDLINNLQTAEQLPRVDRQLNFRVTVRDNRGGVNEADAQLTVAPNTGPFAVTSPNGGEMVGGGTPVEFTWNVVGTAAAPINAANVKISLSLDGGLTFPTVLEAATPNDGQEAIFPPNGVISNTARIKIEAVGNIFFDISNANFSIAPGDGCLAVSGISPGIINTGGQVVVTGVNFTGVTMVNFTGANVTCPSANCTVNNDTQITVTVPGGAATGPLTLVKPTCPNLPTAALTICPNPPVTIQYDSGGVNGASSVGANAYYVIRATPTTYPATLANVVIRFDGFQQITAGAPFTVVAAPSTSGSTNINGVNFQTVNAVVGTLGTFVNYPVTPVTINAGDFVVGFIAPAGGFPGLHDGSATPNRSYTSNGGATFDAFTDGDLRIRAQVFTNCGGGVLCPTVTGINPTSGMVGSQVVITGTNFTGVNAVRFTNNVNALTFTVNSNTQLTVTVPAGATTGPITLGKPNCNDVTTDTFTVTQPPNCPTVTGINPTTGGIGSQVVITGTNFTNVNALRFTNNVNAPNFTVNSATQITVTVPTGAMTGPITLSKPNCNDVLTGPFTVTGCPNITITPNTLPNGTVGNTYTTTTLTASGGGPGYSFSVVPANGLPPGLLLTPVVGSMTMARVEGTPTAAGTFTFTIRATDNVSFCMGDQQYTVTITCPTITVNPPTLPNGMVGTAYSRQLSATGGPAPYTFMLMSGTLPDGLMLVGDTIMGTPTQVGTSNNIVLKATDANQCTGMRTYSLTIDPPACPTVTGIAPANGPVGTPVTITGTNFTGVNAVTFTNNVAAQFAIVNATTITTTVPTGATTGVITIGKPNCNNVTTGTFTVTPGCPTITVNPPVLPNAQQGANYNQPLSAMPVGTYTFAVTNGTPPIGITLTNGVLTGTPTVSGNFTFTITATDANQCPGTREYTLAVCPLTTITPAPPLPNGTVGLTYTQQTFTATPAPPSGTLIWSTSGNVPPGLNVSTGGVLGGMPTMAGSFTFTVTATAGTAPMCAASRQYTVTINPAGNGLQFYPLPRPLRLLDTRPDQSLCDNIGVPITGGTSINLQARVTCQGVTIPATAQAVVGNVTVINQTASFGFLTLFPAGQTLPLAANIIYEPGQLLANNFTVGLSAGGEFSIFAERTLHTVIDVSGYFAPPGAGGLFYHALPRPLRLLDTRPDQSLCDMVGLPITGGTALTTQARISCNGLTIPAAAQAIVGNATVINQTASFGFMTLFPSGQTLPLAANMIYAPGQLLSNYFTVGLSAGGQFDTFAERTLHLVIDVAGYYSTEANDLNGPGLLFNPLPRPLRLLDTRPDQSLCDNVGLPIAAGTSLTTQARITCGGITIPAAAQAVNGNVTVINQTASFGFMTLFPAGQMLPLAANMIYAPGQLLSNAFVVGLSGTGEFNTFGERTIHVVIDVSGYFAP